MSLRSIDEFSLLADEPAERRMESQWQQRRAER
jgi:hypothetical protein